MSKSIVSAEDFAKEYFGWNASEVYPCTYLHQDDIVKLLNRYQERLSDASQFKESQPTDQQAINIAAAEFVGSYGDTLSKEDKDVCFEILRDYIKATAKQQPTEVERMKEALDACFGVMMQFTSMGKGKFGVSVSLADILDARRRAEVMYYEAIKPPDSTPNTQADEDVIIAFLKFIGSNGYYVEEDGTVWKNAFQGGEQVNAAWEYLQSVSTQPTPTLDSTQADEDVPKEEDVEKMAEAAIPNHPYPDMNYPGDAVTKISRNSWIAGYNAAKTTK
jgi:hypothetical protein